jgi:hypothetical protein
MTQPRPYHYTRRVYTSRAPQRRTFQAQGEALAQKAIEDVTWAGLARIGANAACRAPYPDYALCRTLDDLAIQQANKASDSLVTLCVFALFAAVVEGI